MDVLKFKEPENLGEITITHATEFIEHIRNLNKSSVSQFFSVIAKCFANFSLKPFFEDRTSLITPKQVIVLDESFFDGIEEIEKQVLDILKQEYQNIEIRAKLFDIGYGLAILETRKSSLTVLDLSDSVTTGNLWVENFAKALKTNTTLKSLNLTNTGIGNDGAKYLAEALKTNITLTDLDLSYNEIGREGVEALAKAVATRSKENQCNIYFSNKLLQEHFEREKRRITEELEKGEISQDNTSKPTDTIPSPGKTGVLSAG